MIYQNTLRARWHDTDAALTVRPSSLLVYMQEMAFEHLDTTGQNLDRLRYERSLAFILTRLTLKFYRPIGPGQTVRGATWVAEGKGLNFPRYFRLSLPGGAIAAEGASTWILLDLNTHLPVRAADYDYGFSPEAPLPFATPRRFSLPSEMVEVGQRKIVYSDIDYNGHMNNTRYPDMVCDYLPAEIIPHIHTMHLEFSHEAKFGATLRVLRGCRPGVAAGEQVYLLQTVDEQGQVCLCAEVWVKD